MTSPCRTRRSAEIAGTAILLWLFAISSCAPADEGGGTERFKRQSGNCTVRLTDGPYAWVGVVEVFTNGDWERVCSDDWDLTDAAVVCKQMGYLDALDGYGTFPPDPSFTVGRTAVQCAGDEASLCDCPSTVQTDCSIGTFAVATCQTQVDPFGIRLVEGGVAWEGRVEVRVNDEWGTVCSLFIGRTDADVMCRELGYPQAFYVFTSSTYYGAGSGHQLLDFVGCSGNETSIFDCPNLGIGQIALCDHGNDLGVVCEGEVSDEVAPIRLVGGADFYEGRLEVLYNGVWGTVCNNDWSLEDAHVVCRQLGLGPATDHSRPDIDNGVGVVWLSNVECGNMEGALSDCTHPGWAAVSCSHVQDVKMDCSVLSDEPFAVRLVGGSSTAGRVEVYYASMWGTVCDIGWDLTDANVVCRQLGYAGATTAIGMATYGESEGVVWMEAVGCSGSERSLADCTFPGWAETTCNHSRDAGVVCEATMPDGAVRLVNGPSDGEGRVEVFYSGTWGVVCGDMWDYSDGDVVCRQLGYLRARRVTTDSSYGHGTVPAWLSSVGCLGEEEEIAECSHSGWDTETCSHGNAGVACTNDPELPIRLMGGASGSEGRVEIFYEQTWGTVCDNTWDLNDAAVVCSHLGFLGAVEAPRAATFGGANDSTPIWLEDVHCTGQEATLDECPHGDYGLHTCIAGHREDAGVRCEVDPVVHPVRLVGGRGPWEGRLEVFVEGEWGTVCNDFFNGLGGAVVCRQLGYTGVLGVQLGVVGVLGELPDVFQEGQGRIWLDSVRCRGNEEYLTSCPHRDFGVNNCDHNEDVGVVCDAYDPGEDGAIRLVGGDGQSNGRVEVFHEGEWGTVCDNEWGQSDAEVVCRQLGFSGAHSGPRSSLFGGGLGTVWLDRVQCTGSEERLDACGHTGWGNVGMCLHSNDASVVCRVPPVIGGEPSNYDVRLVPGDQGSGLLQVYFNGVWGTVCMDGFTDIAARVVCRQLGYSNGSVLAANNFTSLDGVIWLGDVQCLTGEEENMDVCSHTPWGIHDCPSQHTMDVAVQCQEAIPPPPTTVIPPSLLPTPIPSSSYPSSSPPPTDDPPVIVGASSSKEDHYLYPVIAVCLLLVLGVVAFVVIGSFVLAIHRKRRKRKRKIFINPVSYSKGEQEVVFGVGSDQASAVEKPPLEHPSSPPFLPPPPVACWDPEPPDPPTAPPYYNHDNHISSYGSKWHTHSAENTVTPSPMTTTVHPAHSFSGSQDKRRGPVVARTMSFDCSSSVPRERAAMHVHPLSVASSEAEDSQLARLGSVGSGMSIEERQEVEKELDHFVAAFSKDEEGHLV